MTHLRVHWSQPDQARTNFLAVVAPWVKTQLDAGESIDVHLSVAEDDRSILQNKFYWGYVLKSIAAQARVNGQRYTADAWHELFKRQMLGYEIRKVTVAGARRKRVIRSLRSTAKLSVKAMSKYLDAVMAFAASDLGVTFAVPAWEQYDPHNPALVDQDTGEIRQLEHP